MVNLKWFIADKPYFKGSSNLDYTASLTTSSIIEKTADGRLDYPIMRIHLRRKFVREFLETVGPTGLLVVISWVSPFKAISDTAFLASCVAMNVVPLSNQYFR